MIRIVNKVEGSATVKEGRILFNDNIEALDIGLDSVETRVDALELQDVVSSVNGQTPVSGEITLEANHIPNSVLTVNGVSPDGGGNVSIAVADPTGLVRKVNGQDPNISGEVTIPVVMSVNNSFPDGSGNVTLSISGGAVATVNSIAPDMSGDVALLAADIPGAVTSVNSTAPDGSGNVVISIPTIPNGIVFSVNGQTPDGPGNVALPNIPAYSEMNNISGTATLDLDDGSYVMASAVLTGSTTLDFDNVPTSPFVTVVLVITQDNTGGHALTITDATPIGYGPDDINTASDSTSIVVLTSTDSGATWLARYIADDWTPPVDLRTAPALHFNNAVADGDLHFIVPADGTYDFANPVVYSTDGSSTATIAFTASSVSNFGSALTTEVALSSGDAVRATFGSVNTGGSEALTVAVLRTA